MHGMGWGEIEAHPEVHDWLLALDSVSFGHAARHIDRLGEHGPLLGEPYTRQLRGKLRELRFYIGRTPTRLPYFITSDRRIILLTVFPKTARRERAEIERADRAMADCLAAGHTAEEE